MPDQKIAGAGDRKRKAEAEKNKNAAKKVASSGNQPAASKSTKPQKGQLKFGSKIILPPTLAGRRRKQVCVSNTRMTIGRTATPSFFAATL
jgi:hypothetical protein